MEVTRKKYRCTSCKQSWTKHTDCDGEPPVCSNKKCDRHGKQMKEVTGKGAINNIREGL